MKGGDDLTEGDWTWHDTPDDIAARRARDPRPAKGVGCQAGADYQRGKRAKVVRFALEHRFDHIQIEGEHGFGKPEE
jgi:putative hydrolase of the HAD superfamily